MTWYCCLYFIRILSQLCLCRFCLTTVSTLFIFYFNFCQDSIYIWFNFGLYCLDFFLTFFCQYYWFKCKYWKLFILHTFNFRFATISFQLSFNEKKNKKINKKREIFSAIVYSFSRFALLLLRFCPNFSSNFGTISDWFYVNYVH